MTQETPTAGIEKLIEPLLYDDIFLVSVKIKPTNNIKIYLDADSGLAIEKCSKINRALYKVIEEKGLFPDGDFSLEVSSPGVDEPLKLLRQYHKNTGRLVEVTDLEGNKTTGKLAAVYENSIAVDITEGKGKKAVVKTVDIPFLDIKQTKVQITF